MCNVCEDVFAFFWYARARQGSAHTSKSNTLRSIRAAIISPAVLPDSYSVFLSRFGPLLLSSNQHFRWGAAPNARRCNGQELPALVASGRLMDITHRNSQHPLEEHWRSRKAAESHCAAVALQLPTSGLGYSALLRAVRVPLQPSNCCSPSGLPPQTRIDNYLRIAERRPAAEWECGLLPQSRKVKAHRQVRR